MHSFPWGRRGSLPQESFFFVVVHLGVRVRVVAEGSEQIVDVFCFVVGVFVVVGVSAGMEVLEVLLQVVLV